MKEILCTTALRLDLQKVLLLNVQIPCNPCPMYKLNLHVDGKEIKSEFMLVSGLALKG